MSPTPSFSSVFTPAGVFFFAAAFVLGPIELVQAQVQQKVISTNADGAISVYAADLDGDDDPDVLSASFAGDQVSWYENLNSGSFSAQKTITTSTDGVQSVYAADLDGDDDLDVLSASQIDDKIAWYRNLDSGGFSAQKIITTSADGAQSVHAGDLDGDGDLDVVSASRLDDRIAWYENQIGDTGADSDGFGAQQTITTSAFSAASVFTADVDGDSDVDIISGSDGGTIWHENDGNASPSFTDRTILTTSSKSVYAVDLDGDSDVDILSAADEADRIIRYMNDGGSDPTFTRHDITSSTDVPTSVHAAHLNGDNAPDVLSAGLINDRIAWYRNRETGGFSVQNIITNSADQARSVHAADLDGDGDTDVLSASENDGKIAWYENAPPQITNVNLGNDGSGDLTFSFKSNKEVGSAFHPPSYLAVHVDGPNTSNVYRFDRYDFGKSGTGPYTYTLSVSQAYDDGAGTYTASVDDAMDQAGFNGGNNGSGSGLTATYQFTADVSLVDGRDGDPYSPPEPSPGTDDNPVGRFELSADVAGATLSDVTVIQDGPTPTGVSSIELWRSSDGSFESEGDTEIASKTYADNTSFSAIDPSIPTDGRYIFVVVDLAGTASGDYNPKVTSESDLGFTNGTLSSVNGMSTTTFTDAYLSASSTPLPVEVVAFEVNVVDQSAVLTWRTASETTNAGFAVQHRTDSTDSWKKVDFVDSNAEGGTTTEEQSYRLSTQTNLAPGTHQFRLQQVDLDGTTRVHDPITVEVGMQQPVRLTAPAPHPVQNRATLSFAVKEPQETTVRLYNLLGQQVATLYRGTPPAGEAQSLPLDASALSSGTYVVRLQAGSRTKIRRVAVVH